MREHEASAVQPQMEAEARTGSLMSGAGAEAYEPMFEAELRTANGLS